MIDISSLFSSKARTKVLKTLHYQKSPLALRHIALLADTPVFSVQCALKQLLKEKIISKQRKAPYVLFELNREHDCYDFLMNVFELERRSLPKKLSEEDHEKARQVLEFSSSTNSFFNEVRL